jgi:hypothetical protein
VAVPLVESVRRLSAALHRLPPPYGPRGLPPGVSPDRPLDDIPDGYQPFLRLADGAECGASGEIRLWSAERLPPEQRATAFLPGGSGRWYAIGDALQNPIFMERSTGQIWWFGDFAVEWHTDEELTGFAKAADDLTRFLDDVVIGPGYRTSIADGADDPWIAAITET